LYDIQLSTTMEAKLNQLTSDISGLIRNFLMKEVSEYRENYEYMLRSPLCQKLLNEIEELKRKQCQDATTNTLPKTDSDVSDGEFYKFDREYALTLPGEKKKDNIELEIKEQEEVIEVTDDEEVVEATDDESDGEEEQEEVIEVTDDEEVVEVTDDESGGEEEEEDVEVTDDESGGEEEEEVVEVTDDESGGEEEESGDEGEESEDDEEEEVFEFEYKGNKYFATDEVNGILYANVDDDIGDEVGKIQNKNVILF